LVIGDAGESVLPPLIRARAGVIVREVRPRVAVVAVVLAHRPPLAFAQIRAPFSPGCEALPNGIEPLLLFCLFPTVAAGCLLGHRCLHLLLSSGSDCCAHLPGFATYGLPPSAFEMSAIAFCARTLLPASSSGGDTTAMPNFPGDTAMIPPPTPL